MDSSRFVYIAKSKESLAGAESEFANRRYNNCANRCYYACYQAAIAALMQINVKLQNAQGQWSHEFVQAQFTSLLINRRKVYPPSLRDTLTRIHLLRLVADCSNNDVSSEQAERVLKRVRQFIETIAKEVN